MRCEALHGDKPMIHPTQLPADVLAEIVSQIQQLLWLDTNGCGRSPDAGCSRSPDRATGPHSSAGRGVGQFSPRPPGEGLGVRAILPRRSIENGDKEWDRETLQYVAAVLEEHGLRPEGDEVGQSASRPQTLTFR